MKVEKKSGKELIFHAVLFEAIAIGLVTPIASWFMNKPLHEIGVFTVLTCFIALTWNMVFNAMFERVKQKYDVSRTFKVRVIHITLFEIGLLSVVIPLAAWWLNISMVEALMFNISVVAFFVPYGFMYNLIFDKIRHYVKEKALNNSIDLKTIG